MNEYHNPKGWSGVGSDVGWCGRSKGGKRCQLCKHHATFDVWSVTWHFYYLTEWLADRWWYWHEYPHFRWRKAHELQTHPVKYNTRGPKPLSLASLKRQGCKPNRRCKCISLVQRGHWYCPDCWQAIQELANIRREHLHDTMLVARSKLKEELMILKLSGLL
jgi:hypothetical protein